MCFFQLVILCSKPTFSDIPPPMRHSVPVKPSNILAFLPTEGKSHFFGFKPLLETLVNRGHNVTLVSPFSLDRTKLPYRFVEVEKTLKGTYLFNFTMFCICDKHNCNKIKSYRQGWRNPKLTYLS